ncbi:hypothetical protein BLS_004831 [Venturia inaequalis]|uniref:Prenylated rab acceptor 1 n=1 Tax=Venturia inaequalis TaxID=5025 RepID=A0A8H3Z7C2_VENIN|nr:hypothetical protein BLS_004831 [Venturia inaequalis]
MAPSFTIPIDALTSRFNFSGRFDEARQTSIATRFSNLKPLGEFFNFALISKPANFSEAQNRASYNLGYFSSNYAIVFLMFFIYSLLTNLTLLFVIVLVVGGMWGIGKLNGQDLDVGPIHATTGQLYGTLAIIAIPLTIFAGPIGTMLWLAGASGVTILGHAAFMDKPIEPSGRRGRYQQQQVPAYDDLRVREISSDEDRFLISQKRRSGLDSDELFFNDGAGRHPRNYSDEHLAYGEDYYESGESYSGEEEGALVAMSRTHSQEHETIARRALERIDRAKAKGKPAVTLTHEEIEALDRRYSRESPERERKRSSPKGNRSQASSQSAWTRQKGSRRASLLAPTSDAPKQRAITAAPKQRSSKSSKNKDPRDDDRHASGGSQAPGFMVQGPGGAPIYTPLGYGYADRAPPVRRTGSGEKRPSPPESRGSSRSSSSASRHAPTQTQAPYPYYDNPRPSARTISQEDYAYAQYQTHGPSVAPPNARRISSGGSPEVSYSNVYRRVPVPGIASRGRTQPHPSDSSFHRPSPIANEYDPSSATSDEDEDEDSEDELASVAPPVQVTRSRESPVTTTSRSIRDGDKGKRRKR